MCDDRDKLQPHDYLVSVGKRSVDEMSLSAVKDEIKNAGSMIELGVRRCLSAPRPFLTTYSYHLAPCL